MHYAWQANEVLQLCRNYLQETGANLTFSPTWNLMIKTLSIGRMDNFFRKGNSCANASFSR